MQSHRSTWSSTPWPHPYAWVGLAALLFLTPSLLAISGLQAGRNGSLFLENGLIESLQLATLIVNSILFAAAFSRSQGVKANASLGLSVLCAVAAIKEVERCGSGYLDGGYCVPAGAKHAAVVLTLLVGLAALLRRGHLRENLKFDLGFVRLWPLCLALPLLGAAEFYDKLDRKGIEEPLELSAYLLVGAYAVWLLRAREA